LGHIFAGAAVTGIDKEAVYKAPARISGRSLAAFRSPFRLKIGGGTDYSVLRVFSGTRFSRKLSNLNPNNGAITSAAKEEGRLRQVGEEFHEMVVSAKFR
jgi:hypothetical protein